MNTKLVEDLHRETEKILLVFNKVFDTMIEDHKRKLIQNMILEVRLHPKETWGESKDPVKYIKHSFSVGKEAMESLRKVR